MLFVNVSFCFMFWCGLEEWGGSLQLMRVVLVSAIIESTGLRGGNHDISVVGNSDGSYSCR